jgi:hypothetical protein
MRNFVILVVLTGLASFIPERAVAKDCRVADPTGTPLNIRMQPNGKIVASVRNGELIQVSKVTRKPTVRGGLGTRLPCGQAQLRKAMFSPPMSAARRI